MHKVKISDASVGQSFERCGCDTLENSCPEHAFVTFAIVCSASPSTTCNQDDTAEEKQVSLSPYSCRGYKKKASNTNPAELVACKKCRIGEGSPKVYRKSDGIGSKEWTRGFC